MRAALTFETYRDGVEVGIFDSSQVPKADNHNKNSSAARGTDVPAREFIPKRGQMFKSEIKRGIEQIIAKAVEKDG